MKIKSFFTFFLAVMIICGIFVGCDTEIDGDNDYWKPVKTEKVEKTDDTLELEDTDDNDFSDTPVTSEPVVEVRHIQRVIDDAQLLDDAEKLKLEDKLDIISNNNQFDVVVLTVDSLDGKSIREYADDYYDYNGYGYGAEYDGCILLVDMETRAWWLSTCGLGIDVFDVDLIDQMGYEFTPDLSDGNYYEAFSKYADCCDDHVSDYKSDRYVLDFE